MLIRHRKSHSAKLFSVVCAAVFLGSILDIAPAFGQDGGPTQPEVHSFEPIGTNQMVDPFTGDFTYNIPLFNIPGPDGGYPINLAYHSGISMEQEASWTGLGWNINVGTINRQVRNLPDDYGGSADDKVTIRTDMKTDWTVGIGAKWTPELAGFDLGSMGSVNPSASLKLYYNSYRGVGYKLGVGASFSFGDQDKITGDLGFNLSLDSQEGVGADVTVGATAVKGDYKNTVGVGTGFNTRTGWQKNLELSVSSTKTVTETSRRRIAKGKENIRSARTTASGGSAISFANSAVGMGVPLQMRGGNGSLSFGTGFNVFTFEGKLSVMVDFSFAKLKDRDKPMEFKGIGYMYYQNANDGAYGLEDDYRVKDFGRDNDGLVHKDTRRLGSPIQTYDIYSVTGQGIGNMFRPYRNDIGANKEPRKKSEYHGANVGLELPLSAPVNIRAGIDVGYNYAHTKTDYWPNANAANYSFTYSKPSMSASVYFQNYGEQTVDDHVANYGASAASEKPVVYKLVSNDNFYDITNVDQNNNESTISVNTTRTSRKRRAMGFEAFTNEMILNTDGASTVVPEFDIQYYSSTSSSGYNSANLASYNNSFRTSRTSTHVGGYTATNTQGMRYVYGLSAYNNTEKNVRFSLTETPSMLIQSQVQAPVSAGELQYKASGTDKFYQSMEKSAYAHSYMLTSILGADYVDFDNIPGPSDGDLGYWVKFNYAVAHTSLNWRTPYENVIYDKGYEMSYKDGKGNYTFGTKEVWYLATVETKTHIAEFVVSPRKDAFAPEGEFGLGASGTAGYYKLDRIEIYSKDERYPNGLFNAGAKPVKTCHFVYDYSLCKDVPGNNGSNDTGEEGTIVNAGGKLTLKKFYFTYRNNGAGATTPYEFEYNTTVNNSEITYGRDAVDRWGNYQPNVNNDNVDLPYVDREVSYSEMAERASLWNLKAINLPSGGRMEVDYESDTYAYVQDQVAMHMVKIVSMDPYSENSSGNNDIAHDKDAPAEDRRVYFKLENPVPQVFSVQERKAIMEKYIRPGEYMYFKVKTNVTKVDDSKEFVAGYAKVTDVDVDVTSTVGSSYIWGYVELDFMKVDGKQTHFHPFTEVGARHIKYNHPELLYDNPGNGNAEDLSKSDIKNAGYSLLSVGTDIVDIFKDFTAMMYGNGDKRLRKVDLGTSCIRLRTVDKIKYGGGHRVKEVRIFDNWADAFVLGASNETTASYGTVYEYDMEENGKSISSGVAAYEPMVGGDENPLHKPIEGWEDKNVLAKTLAQTYTEEPGNESLFPAPVVGYRKVRTMSKNTAEKIANPSSDVESYAGITEHRFYTAKDYPVVRKVSELETDKTFRKSKLIIPALIVNITRLRMAATQGYYIELNDMHGKPIGGGEYAVNITEDNGQYIVSEDPISSVRYEYFDKVGYFKNDANEMLERRQLVNEVDVLYSDIDQTDMTRSDVAPGVLATEIEFIPEARYHESKQISGALNINFEAFGFIPAFYPIPYFNYNTEKTGTMVTNKIFNKTGIVRKTVATERGSTVETENLVFDQYTGQPLLTSVTNAFGDKIYGYSILARDVYEGTGPAYQNIGYESVGTVLGAVSNGVQHVSMVDGSGFFEGDQLLATPVYANGSVDNSRDKLIVYLNKQVMFNASPQNEYVLETDQALTGTYYRFTVIRSGRKNLLATPVSTIVALSDPTINRTVSTCHDLTRKGTNDIPVRSIDNVLNISAMELGHHWNKDLRELPVSAVSSWFDNAFYSKGISGGYTGIRTYVYVDDRTQSETAGITDVDLRTDGVLNDVKMFNWNNLMVNGSGCANNWVEADQVTLKNPSSFTVEGKNILDTYNAALYGRTGTEPIAVAGNAKNSEIGFESFEEYAAGSLLISENSTNNMNFYSSIDQTGRVVEDRFQVDNGEGVAAKVEADYGLLSQYGDLTLRAHFYGYQGAPVDERISRENLFVSGVSGAGISDVMFLNTDAWNLTNIYTRRWRGELFATKTIPDYPENLTNPNVTVSNGMAHTGTKSLRVGNLNGANFLQGRLTLIPGEKYQFSGWFSTPGNLFLMKYYDQYFIQELTLEYFDINGNYLSSQSYPERDIFQGTFIDDWQKFTVDFEMPSGAHYMSVKLPCAQEVYSEEFQDYVQAAYYDDMRIQPLDGGMQTYVYNPENHRLEAELDGNNYATFYYYDDEGSLFLVKRETEKGIITVQESRNYIKKNP